MWFKAKELLLSAGALPAALYGCSVAPVSKPLMDTLSKAVAHALFKMKSGAGEEPWTYEGIRSTVTLVVATGAAIGTLLTAYYWKVSNNSLKAGACCSEVRRPTRVGRGFSKESDDLRLDHSSRLVHTLARRFVQLQLQEEDPLTLLEVF